MILTIFTFVISANKKVSQKIKNLDQIHFIYYFVLFRKDTRKTKIIIIIELRNEVNKINFIHRIKFVLIMQKNDLGAQKIDSAFLKSYVIFIAIF